ncbi:MAG TPA: serine hydrolase domain-containing protein [Polyangiaceae bacterium]|nr:serine hydrolase domain-containing protein [Polyangiaceae bacterium]
MATGWVGKTGFEFAEGAAFRDRACAAGARAFFDLASITKSFVAVTVARLVQQGRLSFETPLHDLLPEARGTLTGSASVLLLLSHRAGLEAHRPLFAPLLGGLPLDRASAIHEAVHGRRPECRVPAPADGHPPVYSDLGFALVGLAVERLERLALDQVVDREVCTPLGLEVGSARVLRARGAGFAARCMPTETVPFRGGEVHGIVHDENAWALSGHGLSGHAGLFGTALGVARFGAALLDAQFGRCSAWLDADRISPLLKERAGGSLRAGFDSKSADQSSAGSLAGERSFGHLGFTGTSFWCDPDAGRVLVLLTNRVCPTRKNPRIRAARPAVNDALYAFRA